MQKGVHAKFIGREGRLTGEHKGLNGRSGVLSFFEMWSYLVGVDIVLKLPSLSVLNAKLYKSTEMILQ